MDEQTLSQLRLRTNWNAIIHKPTRQDPLGSTMVAAGGSMAIDCGGSGESFADSAFNALLIAAAPKLALALYAIATSGDKESDLVRVAAEALSSAKLD
jgi:hypothetical protein